MSELSTLDAIARHPNYAFASEFVDRFVRRDAVTMELFEKQYSDTLSHSRFLSIAIPLFENVMANYAADNMRVVPYTNCDDLKQAFLYANTHEDVVAVNRTLYSSADAVPSHTALVHRHGVDVNFIEEKVYGLSRGIKRLHSGDSVGVHYWETSSVEFYAPEHRNSSLPLRQQYATLMAAHDFGELIISITTSLREFVKLLRSTVPERLFTPLLKQLNICDIISKGARKSLVAKTGVFTQEDFLIYLRNLKVSAKNIGDDEIGALFSQHAEFLEEKLTPHKNLNNGNLVHFGKHCSYRRYLQIQLNDPIIQLLKFKDSDNNRKDMWSIPERYILALPEHEQIKNIIKREMLVEEGYNFLVAKNNDLRYNAMQCGRYIAEIDRLTYQDAKTLLVKNVLQISTPEDVAHFIDVFKEVESVFYPTRQIIY